MKYRFSYQIVIVWLFILVAAGLYLMTLAPREAVASDAENRMLAAFPEVSLHSVRSGEFSEGLENFLSDKLPARSSLAAASKSVMDVFSVLTEEDIRNSSREAFEQSLLEEGETAVSGSDQPEQEPETAPDYEPDEQPAVPENTGNSGIIAVNGKTLVPTPVEDYGYEGYVQDESVLSRETGLSYDVLTDDEVPDKLTISIKRDNAPDMVQYSESVAGARKAVGIYNRLAELVDGTVNVLIPPESAYATNYLDNRDKYAGWESDIEKYMRSIAADNLYFYSVVDILGDDALADEYLYFNSDHHWTPKGCYFAYREMMRRQGIIPVNWDDHAVIDRSFYGTYYSSSNPGGYKKDRIDIITPLAESNLYIITGKNKLTHREFISQNGNSYATAYVYGTVEPWGVIESRCNTGRKCMVLFDSFAKPLFPFLANHYDEQFICDLRHYKPVSGGGKLSEIIETYGIDDIYIVIMPIYVFGGYTMTNMNNYI